jgi:hypothetical protein
VPLIVAPMLGWRVAKSGPACSAPSIPSASPIDSL